MIGPWAPACRIVAAAGKVAAAGRAAMAGRVAVAEIKEWPRLAE